MRIDRTVLFGIDIETFLEIDLGCTRQIVNPPQGQGAGIARAAGGGDIDRRLAGRRDEFDGFGTGTAHFQRVFADFLEGQGEGGGHAGVIELLIDQIDDIAIAFGIAAKIGHVDNHIGCRAALGDAHGEFVAGADTGNVAGDIGDFSLNGEIGGARRRHGRAFQAVFPATEIDGDILQLGALDEILQFAFIAVPLLFQAGAQRLGRWIVGGELGQFPHFAERLVHGKEIAGRLIQPPVAEERIALIDQGAAREQFLPVPGAEPDLVFAVPAILFGHVPGGDDVLGQGGGLAGLFAVECLELGSPVAQKALAFIIGRDQAQIDLYDAEIRGHVFTARIDTHIAGWQCGVNIRLRDGVLRTGPALSGIFGH